MKNLINLCILHVSVSICLQKHFLIKHNNRTAESKNNKQTPSGQQTQICLPIYDQRKKVCYIFIRLKIEGNTHTHIYQKFDKIKCFHCLLLEHLKPPKLVESITSRSVGRPSFHIKIYFLFLYINVHI